MSGRAWTEAEDAVLRDNPEVPLSQLAAQLGRGLSAARHRKRALGLLAPRSEARPWTDEELGFLADHSDWPNRRIGEELGRTMVAVREMRKKVGKGWTRAKADDWSAEEDQVLLDYGKMSTAANLQERLPGRTWQSIQRRRMLLGIDVPTGNELIAYRIGARPLIAKTCTSCGRLLQADWFKFDTFRRSWLSACRRCLADIAAPRLAEARATGRYLTSKEAQAEQRRRSAARLEAQTRPTAIRLGEEYTEADYKILADPDLTLTEKALRTRRTYAAVQQACWTLGYRSHRGLGEPEDLWRIVNPSEGRYAGQKLQANGTRSA